MTNEKVIVFPSWEFDQTGIKLTPHEKVPNVYEIGNYAFAFISGIGPGPSRIHELASVKGRYVVNKNGSALVRVSPFDGHVLTLLDTDKLTLLRG